MSGHNGVPAGLTTDELRAAVRAVLRDVLPAAVAAGPHPDVVEEVTLRTAGDLDSFVRHVAALCEDPVQRDDLQDGRRRFRLAGAESPTEAPQSIAPGVGGAGGAGGVVRVDRGAVTERTVKKAAADGARLVVGPRAVLTPLARDRARSLGVRVEREER